MGRKRANPKMRSTRAVDHKYSRLIIDQEFIESAPVYQNTNEVWFHDCDLDDGTLSVLALYPNLKSLYLTGHEKVNLSLSGIENCPKLVSISATGYNIVNLDGIEFCASLRRLKCRGIEPACQDYIKEVLPNLTIEIKGRGYF